jgi:hypothetical protein
MKYVPEDESSYKRNAFHAGRNSIEKLEHVPTAMLATAV